MGWFSRALGLTGPVVEHAHALTAPAEQTFAVDADSIPAEIFGLQGYANPVAYAPRVDRKSALSVPAVSRSRDLIAGTIGTLPLDMLDSKKAERPSSFLEQPERGVPRVVTITRTVEDLLFDRVAFWLVTERGSDLFPLWGKRIAPHRVEVDEDRDEIRIDGKLVNEFDVIQFVSPRDGVLTTGARAIRSALLLDDLARRFAENPQAREYFVPAEGADPADDAAIKTLLNEWQAARQSGVTGYVPAALKLEQGQLINPRDLQLADARQHAVLEIARVFGIDADDLGVSVTSRTYQNLEQSRRERVTNTLQPFISAVEQRLSLNDVCPRGTYVRFNLDGFLRGDTTTRYSAYSAALAGGFLTVDEVRELEDRQPLAGAERNADVTNSAATVAASNFADESVELTFDAPAAAAQFKVDLTARTITGLAVPYGAVARSNGRDWSFAKGSLKWDDVSRVKFLDGHDWGKPIGRAVKLEDTDAGLVATFKVIATPAGDEALLMASELVKDGLSIGVGLGGTYDEKDGVLYAVAAPLAEVSLTPTPAFDSARVTAVAASKHISKEGTAMTDTKVTPEADASVTPQFTAEQIAALTALVAKPAEEVKPEPQKVAQFTVTEAAPYRFDGVRGEHDFSSDLFAGARGDSEAMQRATKFTQEAFQAATFDVDSANVASLNPARNRPDMYVDQKAYVTPFYDALYKGPLADQTPFTFPKFTSASGLVGDHTEGVEPTPGSFVAGSQTVTPTASSGKVEITREVFDAGGNPQVSGLIWNKMVRAWYEALEAKAVAVLDAATPTAIALATAAVDAALVDQLEGELAGLQFVRGGNTFNFAGTHVDLYKRLADATDSTGRKLLPIYGPTNANGQARSRFASLDVAGVEFVPAWSLGASGAVSESSYLVDTNDVHVWNTAPQRLEFQYRVAYVDLAIWGYSAAAISDLTGVREITYDPTA
ncbi:phage portal protein [Kribbella sp. DT2]|uniref:phage portal protein n=1 Tax=Kribbella sp. DT2 TaxID=3393427 RepID=UPI003CF39BF0